MLSTGKNTLTKKIIVGMLLGILIGSITRNYLVDSVFVREYIVDGLFYIIGQVFITALKMLVVPLIFVSLVCGTCSLTSTSTLGRMSVKTIILYLVTTAIAISLAIGAALILQPGNHVNLSHASSFDTGNVPSFVDVIVRLFPNNPVNALASGNTLQIIVFALLFGVSIMLAGVKGEPISRFFTSLNDVMMKMVALIMNLAPYGIFCLLARIAMTIQVEAIFSLVKYFFVVLGVLVIQVLFTYCGLLKLLARVNPIIFIKKMRDAMIFAFSTASSNATIPVSMETATQRLGVSNRIASFTIPLGSTLNMDGTAIMQGVATVFIAQAFNIHLGITDFLMVIMTATLASIGTAGVPGVGLITLTMVLQQVGLPVEGIGLIIGVDRLLDMARTAVNITGDCAVSCVVAHSEKDFNRNIFNDMHAADEIERVTLKSS